MADSSRVNGSIRRDLYVFEDENNPRTSQAENVLPSTILDQVYDDLSPTKKNLRTILEELRQEIITGGRGNIKFPVTSVNGMMDDVVLNKKNIGLDKVDNTSDIDKPLSNPQRQAVMEILKGYDFKVNLDELYAHLMNTDNPHDVTLEQINKDDVLATFVKHYIGLHNTSQSSTVHADIRGSLRRLWVLVDGINGNVEEKIETVLESLDNHLNDENAHFALFEKKENIDNKVVEFNSTTNVDHTKYPTTRAVVEFVAKKLVEFEETLPNIEHWIDDIKVVERRSSLPRASVTTFHKAYFIRYGETSHPEIAICRLNPDGKTFDWDITPFSTFSKYNQNHFEDTTEGFSIKMGSVVDAVLGEDGALNTSLSNILNGYYTKTEIDDLKYINHIKILPGTTDGTIRFYTNNDLMTMSEDIHVAGLKRLAYLEWVTENEIWDNAIHERHIVHKAVATKHIQDRAVKPLNIECPYGFIIGNDHDTENPTANHITLEQLATYLRPLIGGWPDPNVPGGNPWYDRLSIQLMQTQNWLIGVEYSFGNGGYGIRFTGNISCIENMRHKLLLTQNITTITGYILLDAGGAWMYQSDPDEEWTVLGGSNITGHTFGTVTLDKNGLYLETISTGNRINAPFDVWIKYTKTKDINKYPVIQPPYEEENPEDSPYPNYYNMSVQQVDESEVGVLDNVKVERLGTDENI